ncbi:hypothetical protein [Paenibacillus qinlingensis]|nr:hypothetical protein [Paenibacillus qinlingensis]
MICRSTKPGATIGRSTDSDAASGSTFAIRPSRTVIATGAPVT